MLNRSVICLIIFSVLFLPFFAAPARADFASGLDAYNARHWKDAVVSLRPLADKGDARAMILLGNMYDNGYGLLTNHKEAARLYKRAAAQNNVQAINAVGAMYVHGQGVPANLKTARAWFSRSARLGDQTGALFYALILFEGNKNIYNPATPDLAKAYQWFKICAAGKQNPGYADVCARAADKISRKFLKKDEIARLDKKVAAWKPLSPKDLGPVPPDPAPPAETVIKKQALQTLKHQDKNAVQPKPLLP